MAIKKDKRIFPCDHASFPIHVVDGCWPSIPLASGRVEYFGYACISYVDFVLVNNA